MVCESVKFVLSKMINIILWLGQEYIPFNEMPELKNIVLTGREDNENAIG